MRKAIFFDRDGTLNEFKLGDYITQVEELVLLNGAARTVKKANAAGYLCIIVTNQGGVIHNRGVAYSEVERINDVAHCLVNKIFFLLNYFIILTCLRKSESKFLWSVGLTFFQGQGIE